MTMARKSGHVLLDLRVLQRNQNRGFTAHP